MRRALIVGIDHYPVGRLTSCVNDANAVKQYLDKNEDGTPNFDCQLMISHADYQKKESLEITRYRLKRKIHQLFSNEAQVALLYFSGHGGQNDFGGYLITQDAVQFDEGVSINEILLMANRSKVKEIIIILDCCYSGSFGNDPMAEGKLTMLREGVSILTSSSDYQTSKGRNGRGVFTELICEALEGEAADILGRVDVASIYQYADQVLDSWEQRPVFKTHATTMVSVRNCQPRVHLEILRKLADYFSGEDDKLKLSEEHLIGDEPSVPAKELEFSHLQMYLSAGLITLSDEDYQGRQMSEAAQEGKECELTKLGEYYWKLAKNGRL